MSGEKHQNHGEPRRGPIIGVDILPGKHPSSHMQPHYAAAVVDPETCGVVETHEDVSLSRLIRLIWEIRPSIIAIDNVFELAEDEKKLSRLLSMLPPGTKLVQVTGWGREAANIKTVARRLGIEVHGKPSPLKTAAVAAEIACRGHGFEIRFAEEKTRIIVSRGRTVSHGGMSYNRYRRSIRAGILSVTKEIKRILDRNKLDYDLTFRKSHGGLERSVFTVYAPREKLYGLIKPIKTKSVRVEIEPIYRDRIILPEPVQSNRRPIILGIDPGIYTGVAAIDLDGTPLLTYSSKNLDRGEIISMALSIGTPVIVATDVNPAPETVKKLAAALKAQLYTPPENMSTSEKQLILSTIEKRHPWLVVDDTHERDALAAAYKAYLSIADKLRQVDARLARMSIDIDPDTVKTAIIRGKTMAEAIEEEITRLMRLEEKRGEEKQEEARPVEEIVREYEETIARLNEKIGRLEAEKRHLEEKIRSLEATIETLRVELTALRHQVKIDENTARLIERLRRENNALRDEIARLRERLEDAAEREKRLRGIIGELVEGHYIPAPIAPSPVFPSIARAARAAEEKNTPVIYIETDKPPIEEAQRLLAEKRIAVLYRGETRAMEIPLISIDEYRHHFVGETLYVEPGVKEAVEELWRTIDERRRDEEYEKIVRLIERYREERRRLFEKMRRKTRLGDGG